MSQISLEISNRYKALAAPAGTTRKLFQTLAASNRFPVPPGELSIAFVDDAAIADIHDRFMDDPSPTDVITFPGNPEMESAGEIIVSVDHARSRADELGEPFARELSLYLVHGWLHLAGYRDKTDAERGEMRAAEREALALLDQAGALGSFKLRK